MAVSSRVSRCLRLVGFAQANDLIVAARLIQSSAKEAFLPKVFTRLSSRNTPDNALALQTLLTLCFIVFGGGFRGLVNFISVTSWTFYLLTVRIGIEQYGLTLTVFHQVVGLLILRYTEPNLERCA